MFAPILRGRPFADVLLLNGPGTCVVLCLAVYLTKASISPLTVVMGTEAAPVVPWVACSQSDLC